MEEREREEVSSRFNFHSTIASRKSKIPCASLRIRALRRQLRRLRRQVHAATSTFGGAAHAMPGVQKAGAQNSLHVQLAETGFHLRCQESRFHRAETRRQGRVR